jgi:2-octaprenyl-6-methoxyphenol hydroxylase
MSPPASPAVVSSSSSSGAPFHLAVIGAGPVGLALALLAAQRLPEADITVFDARPATLDVGRDPRTLALALGSVHLLRRLGAWAGDGAHQPIREVHVSQGSGNGGGSSERAAVRLRAEDEGVEMLGAVLTHGAVVHALQQAWTAAVAVQPQRLHSRFDAPVQALKPLAGGIELDAGVAERFHLVVIAEGGVFRAGGDHAAENDIGRPTRLASMPIQRDYGQTAWVGHVTLAGAPPGVAFERFTDAGPLALLPLPPQASGTAGGPGGAAAGVGAAAVSRAAGGVNTTTAALVWCVNRASDPVRERGDEARIAALNASLHPQAGRVTGVSPLKAFDLGLLAQRTLVEGRCVRIGNAAQTLHPVAGQGLNLGLRDAFELVQALAATAGAPQASLDAALARLERRRRLDRWSMIAATDFLARSFTWRWPGVAAARGLGLAALQAGAPLKSLLAQQMMFGYR